MPFLLNWLQIAWFAIEPMEWLTIGLVVFAGIQLWVQAGTERSRRHERDTARDEAIDRAFQFAWAEHFRVDGLADRLKRGDLIEMAYLDILNPTDVLPSDNGRYIEALSTMGREAGFLGGVTVSLSFEVQHSIALLNQSVKAFARQAPAKLSEPEKVKWLRDNFGADVAPWETAIRKLVPEVASLMWDASIHNSRASLVRSLNFNDNLTSEFGKTAVKSLLNRAVGPQAPAPPTSNQEFDMSGPLKPDRSDYQVLYQVAHHDAWQAKSQQWSVANWAFALLAGLVGIATLVYGTAELALVNTWWLAGSALLVSIGSGWYLRRLQRDLLLNRRVYRALEERTGIKAAKAEVGANPPGLEDDAQRGREFAYIMAIGIGCAAGFSYYIFSASLLCAILTAVALATLNVLFVRSAT